MGADTMSVKQTLQVEWREGHWTHKNPVVVSVSLSFVRASAHPGYPGSEGHEVVVCWKPYQ